MKTKIVGLFEENCSINESKNEITTKKNKQRENWETENEKFRNSNKKFRGKPHKHNTRYGRISGIEDKIEKMVTPVK